MIYYADEIGDTSLREKIIEEWGDEINSYFNE